MTCEKPLQFFFLRKAILYLPKGFPNLYKLFSCGRLSSTEPRPFQNLYNSFSCGRLSSNEPRPFQNLNNFFSCGRLSSTEPRPFQNLYNFFSCGRLSSNQPRPFQNPYNPGLAAGSPRPCGLMGGCPWCLLTDLRVAPLGADSAGFAVLCSSPRACTMTRRRCPPTVSVR